MNQSKQSSKVTIVMYHYVRDMTKSKYPGIKGLDLPLFIEQLDYIQQHYYLISMEHLIHAIENDELLPPKSALLTFDDAYADHFYNVFPILLERKIQGSFFAPAKTILENKVLDVNKIHYILASVKETHALINRTYEELNYYRGGGGGGYNQLNTNEFYYNKLAIADEYDSKDVIFFKRLLQRELPEDLRKKIIDRLFIEFVGKNENEFSRELYMNKDQLKCMIENGMHVGHHGYDHYWLSTLSNDQQELEISKGLDFLRELGVDMKNWTMCYPYGSFNQSLIDILKNYDCKLALTTIADIGDISKSRYKLARLDTNDIPKERNAEVNEWFLKG